MIRALKCLKYYINKLYFFYCTWIQLISANRKIDHTIKRVRSRAARLVVINQLSQQLHDLDVDRVSCVE